MDALAIAKLYIGKREIPGNMGFEDKEFETDMRTYGEWIPPYAWCCCFMQMVFRRAFPLRSSEFKKLFDPSTAKTFENFKSAGFEISQKPFVGALVIWALYSKGIRDPQKRGHAGIVESVVNDVSYKTIEGNGSKAGSRNGEYVVNNPRKLVVVRDGLNLLGFIKVV